MVTPADQSAPPAAVPDTLARTLLGGDGLERPLDETLGIIVADVVAALPRVTGAGALVGDDGTVAARAASDAVAATLDGMQLEWGEGPYRDCRRLGAPVDSDDLAVDGTGRWPRFAPAALSHQVRAVCSVPLVGRHLGAAGALNLYATDPGAFDASCIGELSRIASHAALAVHAAQRVVGLNQALRSRDVIGQAKGILVERFGLSDQQAFEMLATSSQETNMKLRDVAAWLLDDARRHAR